MDVNTTIQIDNEHFIEIGNASWDKSILSIRRRKNNSGGSFDPISSSEIEINGHADIAELICVCLKYDLINKQNMTKIMEELYESIKRKGYNITIK